MHGWEIICGDAIYSWWGIKLAFAGVEYLFFATAVSGRLVMPIIGHTSIQATVDFFLKYKNIENEQCDIHLLKIQTNQIKELSQNKVNWTHI